MTDLERIELACRRITNRPRTDGTIVGTDAVVSIAMDRVFEALAAELREINAEVLHGYNHEPELEALR